MHEDGYEYSLVRTYPSQHSGCWNGDRCALPVSLCRSNYAFSKSKSEGLVIFDGFARTADDGFETFVPAIQFPVGKKTRHKNGKNLH